MRDAYLPKALQSRKEGSAQSCRNDVNIVPTDAGGQNNTWAAALWMGSLRQRTAILLHDRSLRHETRAILATNSRLWRTRASGKQGPKNNQLPIDGSEGRAGRSRNIARHSLPDSGHRNEAFLVTRSAVTRLHRRE